VSSLNAVKEYVAYSFTLSFRPNEVRGEIFAAGNGREAVKSVQKKRLKSQDFSTTACASARNDKVRSV
jgi:hypothetical protein